MRKHPKPRAALAGIFVASAAALFAQSTATPADQSTSAKADDYVLSLEAFTVSAEKSSGYRATNSITATGIGTKIADTPLAISVVTSEFIKDRNLNDLYEALQSVPGVLTNPRSESAYTVRGFGGNITYRNGQYRRQLHTSWNIDQVEVILGPSAIFFGAVRPGGIVNFITKKPLFDRDFTDVGASVGTEGYYKGEIYHNQVLNDELAVRVGVGAIDDSNSNRDFFYKREYYTGASAIWKPTPNQQITIDLEAINRKQFYLNVYAGRILSNSKYLYNPAAIAVMNKNRAAASDTTAWLGANGHSTSVGVYDIFAPVYGARNERGGYGYALASDGRQFNESRTVDFDYLLKITDSLVFQSTWNYGFDDASGLQIADADTRVFADGTMRVRYEDWINVRHSHMIHNKLTWRFNLGPTKHTIQLGQDFQYVRFTRPGFVNPANNIFRESPGNNDNSPYYYYNPSLGVPLSLEAMRAASGQNFNAIRERWEENYGLFLVDQMQLFNDRLFLMGGARDNRFTGKIKYNRPVVVTNLLVEKDANGLADYDLVGSKGKITPQAGALFKITPTLGAYATWSTSIEPNFAIDADGVTAEPVESSSWDFGLKADFFDNRLTATAAYYDIERENLSYRDTARENTTGRSPYYIFGNSEASKGAELNVNYSPVDNYQLVFGWSHLLEAKTTKSNTAALVGRRFGYTPENTLSIWNRYSFQGDVLKGLVFGLGVRYHDGAMASQGLDVAVKIPPFTVYDAMLSYPLRLGARNYNLQLNVKNLTDKFYRDNADGFIGEPRRAYLSVSTRF
jgi:iron complex outermembrane recepter protein